MNKVKSRSQSQSHAHKPSQQSETIRYSNVVLSRDSELDFRPETHLWREDSLLDYKSDTVSFFYKEILKRVIEDCSYLPPEDLKDSDEEPTYDTEPIPESDEEECDKDILTRLLPSALSSSKLRDTMVSHSQLKASKNFRKASRKNLASQSLTSGGSGLPKKSIIKIDSVVQHLSIYPWDESGGDESEAALEAVEEVPATRMTWIDDKQLAARKMMITFVSGIVYQGDVQGHRLHGQGMLKWPNGVFYVGDFKDGVITGSGKITYHDLSYYQGHFVNCVQDGLGGCCISYPDISYSGQWVGGVPNGHGYINYTESDCYVGTWQDGQREGLGTRVYSDKAVYTGMWKDGRPNGEGSMVFSNRDYYEGEWLDGKPHGYGEYTWSAGLNPNLTFSIERKYSGHFINGLRDGYGVQVFGMNGSKVASQFDDNMKSGAGILICGDGTTMEKKPLFLLDNPVSHAVSQFPDKNSPSHDQFSWVSLRGTNHSLRDTLLRASAEAKSKINETFPQIEHLGKPLEFPLHATAADIEIDYHVGRFVRFLNAKSRGKPEKEGAIPLTGNSQGATVRASSSIAYNERHLLGRAIANNYVYLKKVYQKYATLNPLQHCCPETKNPAMCRLRLWQFLRDIRVCKLRVSLIDVDLMLLDVPNIHLETEHDPFETIYYWQFMHCLLLLAFVRCQAEHSEATPDKPSYHEVFSSFVEKVIRPCEGSFEGRALFVCKDLVPITSVYGLYKSVGEAHSARALLNRICHQSKFPLECLAKHKRVYDLPPSCQHFVLGGSTVVYCHSKKEDAWQEKEAPLATKYADVDVYSTDLKVFKSLGVEKVMSCIIAVCENITEGGDIVFIDYQISFLEFYEILINLAQELSATRLQEEKMKKVKADDEGLKEDDAKEVEKEAGAGRGSVGSGKKKNKRKHSG